MLLRIILIKPIIVSLLLWCSAPVLAASLNPLDANKSTQACADSDIACLKALQKKHITLKPEFWQASIKKPLLERITVAGPEVIEHLGYNNRIYGDPFLAETVTLASQKDLIAAVKAAVDEMPDYLKSFSQKHVAGIVLAKQIGATADVTNVYDKDGRVLSARIALDVDALTRKANTWATWKENTPFTEEGDWRVEMLIEDEANDNIKNAIQYILIHEIAHIVAAIHDIHPTIFQDYKPAFKQQYPWLNYSWDWRKDKSYYSIFDGDFPERADIRYYYGKNVPSYQLASIYKNLEKTDFATLYGATSIYDDWAEAFVSWVHVQDMKRPFSLKIFKGDEFQYEYNLCWGQERCQEKEAFIKKIINKLDNKKDYDTKK